MNRLLKQWKSNPLRVVLRGALICLVLLWFALAFLAQKSWADWLLLPMLCIFVIDIIITFKARERKNALRAIIAFIMFIAVIAQRLLYTSALENTEAHSWLRAVSLICLAVAIILTVVNNMRSGE
jgi:peptidoglycan/LPS O-acetylase OafA/YrhL